MSEARIARIAPEDRVSADPMSGQTREVAVSTDRMWCGIVRAGAGEVTPWHHHGAHSTIAFVTSGIKRLEFGDGGGDAVEASPGDFLHIPAGVVHRESNPSQVQTGTVAFRIGSGTPTIAVEGPARADTPIRRITPVDRKLGDPTPGMVREEAVAGEGEWSGFVRTAAGSVSGWHHHGEHESVIYVLAGAMRVESTAQGQGAVDLVPGDFCFIPPGIVHRESNPSDEESHVVVVRAGSGRLTINVDGPEGASEMVSEMRGKVPPEVEERLEQAVHTFRENHRNPTNLALHGVGYYAILKGVVRFLRHKRFRGLFMMAVGVGLILAGHEIEGTPAFAILKSGDGKVN